MFLLLVCAEVNDLGATRQNLGATRHDMGTTRPNLWSTGRTKEKKSLSVQVKCERSPLR